MGVGGTEREGFTRALAAVSEVLVLIVACHSVLAFGLVGITVL